MKDIAKIKFWTTFKLGVKQNYAVTLQWYSYADSSIFHILTKFFFLNKDRKTNNLRIT
jgi:hypothetical protein